MATINQLSSFMVININGGDRISFTFDEIDAETGEPVSSNNKRSFFVVDSTLAKNIAQIRNYIREQKMSD